MRKGRYSTNIALCKQGGMQVLKENQHSQVQDAVMLRKRTCFDRSKAHVVQTNMNKKGERVKIEKNVPVSFLEYIGQGFPLRRFALVQK
jgi:hypothetical protein